MNTPIVRTRFVLVLVPLVLAIFGASSSAFACVVGTGNSASCTETALNDCLPGGVNFDGTVTFDCGGAVTIPVTTTKTINTDTTIDGGALNGVPQTTITGGGPAGLFFMIAPFTVKNLGLGIASGDGAIFGSSNTPAPLTVINCGLFASTLGIETFATVTVSNSTFSGNTVEAITASADSTVMVDNSNFLGNTGGIISAGTVIVNASTFDGNHDARSTGGNGAAINSSGSLTVANSTFHGNRALNNGGAIFAAGPTTVSNSTFFGNEASTTGNGGAIDVVESGALSVTNCTFDANGAHAGAAINAGSSGSVTVVNSILAGALIALGFGGNCSGTISDNGHNIDDGTTCGFTGTGCATSTGTSFCNTIPQLGPLANNGGPTETMALESGSPTINHGDESVCMMSAVSNLDQRGFVRPGAGATNCSIGACGTVRRRERRRRRQHRRCPTRGAIRRGAPPVWGDALQSPRSVRR